MSAYPAWNRSSSLTSRPISFSSDDEIEQICRVPAPEDRILNPGVRENLLQPDLRVGHPVQVDVTVQVRILFCRSVARPKIDNYSIQLDMRALAGAGGIRRRVRRERPGGLDCSKPMPTEAVA
jgi:hypothetical protein